MEHGCGVITALLTLTYGWQFIGCRKYNFHVCAFAYLFQIMSHQRHVGNHGYFFASVSFWYLGAVLRIFLNFCRNDSANDDNSCLGYPAIWSLSVCLLKLSGIAWIHDLFKAFLKHVVTIDLFPSLEWDDWNGRSGLLARGSYAQQIGFRENRSYRSKNLIVVSTGNSNVKTCCWKHSRNWFKTWNINGSRHTSSLSNITRNYVVDRYVDDCLVIFHTEEVGLEPLMFQVAGVDTTSRGLPPCKPVCLDHSLHPIGGEHTHKNYASTLLSV